MLEKKVTRKLDDDERFAARKSMADTETKTGIVLFDIEVPFDDGFCAVLQVVSSRPDGPFVNPVLFDKNGFEADYLDANDSVTGTFRFEHGDVAYILETA